MWILLALGASLFWGLTYVFNEEVYRKISVFTPIAFTSLVVFITTLAISLLSDNLKTDVQALLASKKLLWYFIGGAIAFLVAEFFIAFSITAKNATLAGLIEISYPIFIALFSYIIFRHNYLNLPTVLGGMLIFIGVSVIYYFNR